VKTPDLTSGLFWLFFSSLAFVGSLRMGIGTVESPNMGFMPAAASALLGMLSIVLLAKTILRKLQDMPAGTTAAILSKGSISVLISVLIYSIIMPKLGYLISTFFLMTFLYWYMERNGIKGLLRGAVLSLLTTIISYYLFAVLLNCPFPAGILKL
jgi:putative tricarboxylic transport membrane protein